MPEQKAEPYVAEAKSPWSEKVVVRIYSVDLLTHIDITCDMVRPMGSSLVCFRASGDKVSELDPLNHDKNILEETARFVNVGGWKIISAPPEYYKANQTAFGQGREIIPAQTIQKIGDSKI